MLHPLYLSLSAQVNLLKPKYNQISKTTWRLLVLVFHPKGAFGVYVIATMLPCYSSMVQLPSWLLATFVEVKVNVNYHNCFAIVEPFGHSYFSVV
jgi:hypothetical protein